MESWAVKKLLTSEKVNKETMYRVLRSLWSTFVWVNFVEVSEGYFLIKFGSRDDRERIFNLIPWLFDQYVLSMVPFVKDKAWESYVFSLIPFWTRIYNIPLELMDRKITMEVGGVVGKVLAIDWRDKGGG